MKREDIVNNVRILLKSSKTISGHFNSEIIDLGNRKYGVDIFSISIRGPKEYRYLYLNGIYKAGVKNFLETIGVLYKEVHDTYVLIYKEENIISEVPIKVIKDLINEYLNQLTPLNLNIDGVVETFTVEAQIEAFYRQMNLVLNDSFLEFLELDNTPILKDQSDKSFLCFSNGVLEVTAEKVVLKAYAELDQSVVWKKQITEFNLGSRPKKKSHFQNFIHNVCANNPERIRALRSAIGYMLHAYHRKSGGQMVILYDEQITDLENPQGGTGKGVVASAIMVIRNTAKIDGKKIDGKGRFDLQDVRLDTEVVWIDDVGKQLDIDRFNSISTDGFNIEQKYKDSILIPAEESPKIILCANIIMDCAGTTRRRRQFVVELSSFYSSKIKTGVEEPIIEEHGCRFFSNDWDEREWNRFYWYMVGCLHDYLKDGLAPAPSINVADNRSRQLIGEDLHNWLQKKNFKPKVDYHTQDLFNEYKGLYEPGNDRFTQRSFSNKLKQYIVLRNQQVKFDTKSQNGKKTSVFRISN
ncbi:DUF5906 domain-containing protein [bacterium]|nr:DUF5906 domain-containing protein [bacterium]